ncbi:hypothetical protein CR513_41247, partial [Mucuna pruriens]
MGKKVSLKPLSPMEACEDQLKKKKKGEEEKRKRKKKEREKCAKRKSVSKERENLLLSRKVVNRVLLSKK